VTITTLPRGALDSVSGVDSRKVRVNTKSNVHNEYNRRMNREASNVEPKAIVRLEPRINFLEVKSRGEND
jgi:hypothetical protein